MTDRRPFSPVTIATEACTGCAACLDSCPTDVFRLDPAQGKAVAAHPGDCHICFLCIDDCPASAIQVDYSLASPRKLSAYAALDSNILTHGQPPYR